MAMSQALALAPALGQGQPQVQWWVQSAPAKGRLRKGLPVLARALVGWILEAELRAQAPAHCSEKGLERQPVARPQALTCRYRQAQVSTEEP